MEQLEMHKGDQIKLHSFGIAVTGVVATVNFWDNAGWDIEIENANVPGGYARWKQWQDGGKIVEVNGVFVG